jgi:hypothetical protein
VNRASLTHRIRYAARNPERIRPYLRRLSRNGRLMTSGGDHVVFYRARRLGSCFDNAVSEAFNSVLKAGYVHRHTFRTRAEARIKIATWITDFHNARRLHSVCGYQSPIDYEREHRAGLTLGLAA